MRDSSFTLTEKLFEFISSVGWRIKTKCEKRRKRGAGFYDFQLIVEERMC